ncbi:hypothetical protein RNAN_2986 [Rheinheimera nanhaiensis E407-8]|uniref:Uncharacterized protein n=1 Tax=Rheinheimera nanhaiensis E407-8 TaxID=562729 RepID=I1E0Z5_9GAMM|nr:hypothetical protein RNAN_2986 [Rheinheimera nanhaiensis E407-8]
MVKKSKLAAKRANIKHGKKRNGLGVVARFCLLLPTGANVLFNG